MRDSLTLEIITPERRLLREAVDSIVLPGLDGFFGVLKDHAPLVAALRIGPLVYRQGGKKHRVAVAGGFFEIVDNQATVLADAAEREEEIDVERARRALERARKRLADRAGDWDLARAEAALQRALNRLRVAGAA